MVAEHSLGFHLEDQTSDYCAARLRRGSSYFSSPLLLAFGHQRIVACSPLVSSGLCVPSVSSSAKEPNARDKETRGRESRLGFSLLPRAGRNVFITYQKTDWEIFGKTFISQIEPKNTETEISNIFIYLFIFYFILFLFHILLT